MSFSKSFLILSSVSVSTCMLYFSTSFCTLASTVVFKIATNVPGLHVSWGLVSQNYRLITELPNTKPTFEFALNPQLLQTHVSGCYFFFNLFSIFVNRIFDNFSTKIFISVVISSKSDPHLP